MKAPVFQISNDVTFYGIAGKVVEIDMLPEEQYSYKVGYCTDGNYKVSSLYDFELQATPLDKIGFGKG